MLDEIKLIERASHIKMIVLDNDGVFTDGKVYINITGFETKAYSIRDGFGIIAAQKYGINFGIITGLLSPIVEYRAKQLGIQEINKGFKDKVQQMEGIISRNNLSYEQVAYMGDDLFDVPVMKRVGLGAAPANAHSLVIEAADWVSQYPGGEGCVRELTELVLKSQGHWDSVLQEFMRL